MLDEWEDTVKCNEKWRKKYPRIYDKAESLSTACSEQSIADDMSLMVVLQEEDNLIANYANDRAPSGSSDNSSDMRRKRRRKNRDPYDYLPGSPELVPTQPSDQDIRNCLHWDNLMQA